MVTANRRSCVSARYYDPSTGQFLTVDPLVAATLSPYGYVSGDPINASDPEGLGPAPNPAACARFGVQCAGGTNENYKLGLSTPGNLCLRNPFGANNGNGGCETTLSTSEGGLALSIVGVIGSAGTLAAGEGVAATALGGVSIAAGAAGSAVDIGPCSQGHIEACVAVGLGTGSAVGGVLSLLGLGGSVAAISSFASGAAATVGDLATAIARALSAGHVSTRSYEVPGTC